MSKNLLRIAHLSTFYHTSTLLMAKGGIEHMLGTDVQWKLFGTGPAIVDAFARGDADLAYIGLPPAIIGMDKDVEIKCIAGGHMEGTVIIGRAERKGFPEEKGLKEIFSQFRGLRIGVPGKGSIHDVILSHCLERFHLMGDIEVVNFKWADRIIDAMHKGQVSAAVGTPALAVALKRFVDGRILCPASDLWPNNPSYGIVVRDGFLNKQRETIERFLKLHEESSAFLRNKPREAAKVIADYVGIVDAGFIMDVLQVSPKYCARLTDEFISSTLKFVRTLKKLGYIGREFSSGEIFDASLIEKVHPEKDHYGDGIAGNS
jgi:NitT/TauT family transport system substrate-binding protein